MVIYVLVTTFNLSCHLLVMFVDRHKELWLMINICRHDGLITKLIFIHILEMRRCNSVRKGK